MPTPSESATNSAAESATNSAAESATNPGLFDAVVNLCKRRGFVFPSAEIYGGIRSTYDYGPLGALMLRNVREAWWRAMIQERDDVVPIDAAILTNPKVWEASGHLATFTDPLVDCRNCKERWRADQIEDECPNCGSKDLTEARPFNLMFKTYVGPVEGDSSVAYLRPETAQGMFVNFLNVLTTMRRKPPFGIAQLGRAFRNEITPGNFVFRTREFEMMELEFFVPPADSPRWQQYWCDERLAWYTRYGIASEKLRLRPHEKEELSHYSAGTTDVEFFFPWGWGELEGIANRTDFDLRAHQDSSGTSLEYFDQATGESYLPHVVEPAAGRDPSDDGVPAGRLRRGRDRWRTAGSASPAPKAGSLPSRCAPPLEEGHTRSSLEGRPAPVAALLHVRVRRNSVDRSALPAPRRDRHPLLRDHRLREP